MFLLIHLGQRKKEREMHRAEFPLLSIRIVFGILCLIAMGCSSMSGSGGGPFGNGDLNGSYHFNLVEVRNSPGSLEHCDEWGTITFDGAGSATGSSTRRCNGTLDSDSESGSFTYNVNPDGTFTITAVGETESDHGQIVHRGNLILLDGTTRTGNVWVHNGFAAKR